MMTSKRDRSQKGTTGRIQEEWIDKSIRETKAEQEEADRLFHDEDTQNVLSQRKLKEWSVPDVIQWLEAKQLHKFILLFQKHHVTGKDLANLKLPFLENYEHISLDEREVLLSELYLLLNPGTVYASEEDLTKIKSPVDKKKYFAAIELAQDKSASLPRSSSGLVFPSNQSSPRSVSSGHSSPSTKPRHKSESGMDPQVKVSTFEKNLSDIKKRRTMPKITQPTPVKSVFDYVQQYGLHCIHCLELSPQQHGDVTMATDSKGHVTIEKVPDNLTNDLHCGDRVLEINGHLVRPHPQEANTQLAAMLNYRSPASIVILTEHISNKSNGLAEDKWNKLHSMLVEMRDTDSLPKLDIAALPTDQDQYLKHTTMLQEEIQNLEDKVKEQHKLSDSLQAELEHREAMMHDLEVSRDKAIEKLKQSRSKVASKGRETRITP